MTSPQANMHVQDYGEDQVYAYLADECHEVRVDKYVYRICGFAKAAQVDGSSETSLGTFSACEDGCRTIKYTNVRVLRLDSAQLSVMCQCSAGWSCVFGVAVPCLSNVKLSATNTLAHSLELSSGHQASPFSTVYRLQGQGCWQGPARSMTVRSVCGPRTELLEVKEPDRCVYEATMASPAECSDAVIQELRDELKQYGSSASQDVKDEL